MNNCSGMGLYFGPIFVSPKIPTQFSVCCGMLRHASKSPPTGPKNRCCGMLQPIGSRSNGLLPSQGGHQSLAAVLLSHKHRISIPGGTWNQSHCKPPPAIRLSLGGRGGGGGGLGAFTYKDRARLPPQELNAATGSGSGAEAGMGWECCSSRVHPVGSMPGACVSCPELSDNVGAASSQNTAPFSLPNAHLPSRPHPSAWVQV